MDSDDEEEADSGDDESSGEDDADHRRLRDEAAVEVNDMKQDGLGTSEVKREEQAGGLEDVKVEAKKGANNAGLDDDQWSSDESEISEDEPVEESDDDTREDAVYTPSPFEATMHDYQSNMSYEGLVKVYIVADKLQDLAMANSVMDTIMHVGFHFGLNPKAAPIHLAYASTAPGSQSHKRGITGTQYESSSW